MKSFVRLFSACALVILLVTPSHAAIITSGVVKIADFSTPIPGGGGNFNRFNGVGNGNITEPSIDGSNVSFDASNTSTNTHGVYAYINGSLTVVANNSTPMPGFAGNFQTFSQTSISGDNVAFKGIANSSARVGIYARTAGNLAVVADTAMNAPGDGLFNGFATPSIDSIATTIYGESASRSGIYRRATGGPLTVIADNATPQPAGVGSFSSVNCNPATAAANAAFWGYNSGTNTRGIYKSVGGVLSKVADSNTPAPGAIGNFTSIDNVNIAMDGGDVVFIAADPQTISYGNLYAQISGTLRLVARDGAARPGGGAYKIDNLTGTSMDENIITFLDASDFSIFRYDVGTTLLSKIIGPGDVLLGKTINNLRYGNQGQSGFNITFWAHFTDNSEGIYMMAIPEPGALSLLAVPMLLARRRRCLGRHVS